METTSSSAKIARPEMIAWSSEATLGHGRADRRDLEHVPVQRDASACSNVSVQQSTAPLVHSPKRGSEEISAASVLHRHDRRQRSHAAGCSIAIVCAIIPPIETTCALSSRRSSSRPTGKDFEIAAHPHGARGPSWPSASVRRSTQAGAAVRRIGVRTTDPRRLLLAKERSRNTCWRKRVSGQAIVLPVAPRR